MKGRYIRRPIELKLTPWLLTNWPPWALVQLIIDYQLNQSVCSNFGMKRAVQPISPWNGRLWPHLRKSVYPTHELFNSNPHLNWDLFGKSGVISELRGNSDIYSLRLNQCLLRRAQNQLEYLILELAV
jgi:hypothetical protein